jgi:hypothetical protein
MPMISLKSYSLKARMQTIQCIIVLITCGIAFIRIAYSQDHPEFWALTVDGRVFLTLEVTHKGTGWGGQISMPSNFEIGPGGTSFTHVSAPAPTEQLKEISVHGNLMIFTTPDGQKWELTISPSRETAQLKMVGSPLDPWTLHRGTLSSVLSPRCGFLMQCRHCVTYLGYCP